jgi:hypothetical protein
VAFTAGVGPSVDAKNVGTFPVTASTTGSLEIAASKSVTVDLNLVGSGILGGGSTTFTNVSLLNTGTVGAQAQVGIDIGHRLTLGPEALAYGTFGSGAPATPGGDSPLISSLRVGGGIGLSGRLGPLEKPSTVVGVQVDAFYESTNSSLPGGATTNIRGGGVLINLGFTLDTTDLRYRRFPN